MTIKRYYSLEEYQKAFPDGDIGYAKFELNLHGFIQVMKIDEREIRKMHKEVCSFIKRMEDAQKRTEKSTLRFKGLESSVA